MFRKSIEKRLAAIERHLGISQKPEACPLSKCPLLQCPVQEQPKPDFGTFTDPRDGREYRTVRIGKQTWMAENLAFDYAGSKVYGNDLANIAKYGRLYTWEQAKKAVPPGWHLPSNEEWDELYHFADGTPNEGGKHDSKTAGKHLKATSGWYKNGNGLDLYGFAALPGGFGYSTGSFFSAGYRGYWWSSSESGASNAYSRSMYYYGELAFWYDDDKTNLQSVRCLQDLRVK